MARKIKSKEVKSFGGVSESRDLLEVNAKDAPVKDIAWESKQIEVESDTNLEDDTGHGRAIVIRSFEFGINPKAFQEAQPTRQELFNSHLKGIEVMLWRDGMKIFSDVEPKLKIDQNKYTIIVAAIPNKGTILKEVPQTLSQIAST